MHGPAPVSELPSIWALRGLRSSSPSLSSSPAFDMLGAKAPALPLRAAQLDMRRGAAPHGWPLVSRVASYFAID
jgi:hypothetical protein